MREFILIPVASSLAGSTLLMLTAHVACFPVTFSPCYRWHFNLQPQKLASMFKARSLTGKHTCLLCTVTACDSTPHACDAPNTSGHLSCRLPSTTQYTPLLVQSMATLRLCCTSKLRPIIQLHPLLNPAKQLCSCCNLVRNA